MVIVMEAECASAQVKISPKGGFDSQTVQSIASIIPTNYTRINKDKFAVRVVNSFLRRTDLKILILKLTVFRVCKSVHHHNFN
jgi:hypothetical protein